MNSYWLRVPPAARQSEAEIRAAVDAIRAADSDADSLERLALE
jgi:hypothetical protein